MNFKVNSSVALHSTTKPGILSMAIHPEFNNLVITGGNDGHALIYDNNESKVFFIIEMIF